VRSAPWRASSAPRGTRRNCGPAWTTRWCRPLAAAVALLGQRAAERGEPIESTRLALLGSVLQAFWWQRYTAAGDGAMSVQDVERVVDDVLVPVAAPDLARSEPARV
jgi:hypothetical protein